MTAMRRGRRLRSGQCRSCGMQEYPQKLCGWIHIRDPDEFIKNLGAEEYERRIEAARNGFMFTLEVLERDYDMQSPEGKTAFFREAARRLLSFEDELERNNYIEAVASAYKIRRESLEKLVAKTAVSAGMGKTGRAPQTRRGKTENKGRRYSDFPESSAHLDDRGRFSV